MGRGDRYGGKEDILPLKIDVPEDLFTNPEKYQSPRMKANFLLFRRLTPEKRKQLSKCVGKIIDYMRKELKLEKWECYFLVTTMHKEFPVEELFNGK